MNLSVLLKSMTRNRPVRNRKNRAVSATSLAAELVEERCLLSSVNEFPPLAPTSNGPPVPGKLNPLTAIPRLNSFAGAPVTIYLDFDGHTESQDWPSVRSDGQSGDIVTPVFDIDNDLTTFSDEELRMIEEMWYRVAEDYSPFNINVTTVEPASFNNFQAIRISIGGDGAWIGSPGGVAFLGAFNNSASNTAYVFTDNVGKGGVNHMKGAALAASHEVGHTFGLDHHAVYDANGNLTAQYDSGRPLIGPIMGAPYGSERETWANAPDTSGVNNLQDDLAIISGTVNSTVKYRTDDHGNTRQTATRMLVTSPTVTAKGVLERNGDSDFFQVETDSGNISFAVSGLNLKTIYGNSNLNFGTNVDLVVRVFDASGVQIASVNPTDSLSASVSISVGAGTYFVQVTNTSEYGALGQYTLSGTVVPLPTIPTMLTPTGTIAEIKPVFQWTAGANAASYELQVDNLTTKVNGYYTATVSTTSITSTKTFAEGTYRARARTNGVNGSVSQWSEYIQFSVDVPTPVTPTIIRPKGIVEDAFPTFEWTSVPNAARYELLVVRTDTNTRVIYKTNYSGTTYEHFSPLPDAFYRVQVRAGNSLNEFSAWSTAVSMRVRNPAPVAPILTAPMAVATSTNPRFVWNTVSGMASYELKVDNLSTGTSDYLRVTGIPRTTSYLDPPYMTQGNYQAFMRSRNGNGVYSAWSPAYRFTVDVLPPATSSMTGPVGPNGSSIISTVNPTFTWTAAARAVKYDLWVNNLTTNTTQIIRQTSLTTTSYTSVANLIQGRYRAFVRGINVANEVGAWSTPFEFKIDEATPDTPTITAPAITGAGYVESSNPTFIWTSVTAASYQFQLQNVSLNTTTLNVSDLTTTSYTVPTEKRLGEYTYRARVRAFNLSGDAGSWSSWYVIQVNVPDPTTPILLGPGDTIKDSTPTFSWIHTSTSFRYEILIKDLLRGDSTVIQVTSFHVAPDGNAAIYTLPDSKALIPSTYRFWVRAFNSQGQASGWSLSKTFVLTAKMDELPTDDLVAAQDLLVASLLTMDGVEPTVQIAHAESVTQADQMSVAPEVESVPVETSVITNQEFVPSVWQTDELALIDTLMRRMADPSGQTIDLSVRS